MTTITFCKGLYYRITLFDTEIKNACYRGLYWKNSLFSDTKSSSMHISHRAAFLYPPSILSCRNYDTGKDSVVEFPLSSYKKQQISVQIKSF